MSIRRIRLAVLAMAASCWWNSMRSMRDAQRYPQNQQTTPRRQRHEIGSQSGATTKQAGSCESTRRKRRIDRARRNQRRRRGSSRVRQRRRNRRQSSAAAAACGRRHAAAANGAKPQAGNRPNVGAKPQARATAKPQAAATPMVIEKIDPESGRRFLKLIGANWIWSPAHTKDEVPVGDCYFRKTFHAEAGRVRAGARRLRQPVRAVRQRPAGRQGRRLAEDGRARRRASTWCPARTSWRSRPRTPTPARPAWWRA